MSICIDRIIENAYKVVCSHKLADGSYCRWLWQNEEGSRKMGENEYGCADAANILYTIGRFPREPCERSEFVRRMQLMQDPKTGLFYEGTHHTIHTTAHCIAALELFDAQPLYPLTGLKQYLDYDKLHEFLWNLDWDNTPWPQSHQGAGLYASMVITRTCDKAWQNEYFSWLREHADPVWGLGLNGRKNPEKPMAHQLYGWFHYFFNHEFAHMPIPYPEKLINTCIDMYKNKQLSPVYSHEIGFMEIDWIFAVNRASRLTTYRHDEIKALLLDNAKEFLAYLESLDPDTDEGMNDLHMLFGAMCAVAELQIALPGEITSEYPLKNVLDRRPFI